MFYLPRICEHCLNPSCAASCPSGAIYKRAEDGIVLVDQDRAAAGGCASPAARTRRSTSTTAPARPRSARSAFRASRSASRRSAPRRAWPAALPRARPVRRRPGAGRGVGDFGHGPLLGAAGGVPRPARPRGDPGGRGGRDPSRLGRRRPALPDLGPDQPVRGGAAAAPGVPDHADGLVHPAAVAGGGRRRETGEDAEAAGNLFAAIDHSASRSNISPSCSPPATRPGHRRTREARRVRSYMRDIKMGREADDDPGIGGDDRARPCSTCTGCWPSPSTTSGT